MFCESKNVIAGCPENYTYNNITKKCESINSINLPNLCPEYARWNSSTNRCEFNTNYSACPPYHTYNKTNNKCESSVSKYCLKSYSKEEDITKHLTSSECTAKCNGNPNCLEANIDDKGYKLRCENNSQKCEANYSLNAAGKCVSDFKFDFKCPQNTSYESGRCVSNKSTYNCPDGFTLDSTTKQCIKSLTGCATGYKLDSETKRCYKFMGCNDKEEDEEDQENLPKCQYPDKYKAIQNKYSGVYYYRRLPRSVRKHCDLKKETYLTDGKAKYGRCTKYENLDNQCKDGYNIEWGALKKHHHKGSWLVFGLAYTKYKHYKCKYINIENPCLNQKYILDSNNKCVSIGDIRGNCPPNYNKINNKCVSNNVVRSTNLNKCQNDEVPIKKGTKIQCIKPKLTNCFDHNYKRIIDENGNVKCESIHHVIEANKDNCPTNYEWNNKTRKCRSIQTLDTNINEACPGNNDQYDYEKIKIDGKFKCQSKNNITGNCPAKYKKKDGKCISDDFVGDNDCPNHITDYTPIDNKCVFNKIINCYDSSYSVQYINGAYKCVSNNIKLFPCPVGYKSYNHDNDSSTLNKCISINSIAGESCPINYSTNNNKCKSTFNLKKKCPNDYKLNLQNKCVSDTVKCNKLFKEKSTTCSVASNTCPNGAYFNKDGHCEFELKDGLKYKDNPICISDKKNLTTCDSGYTLKDNQCFKKLDCVNSTSCDSGYTLKNDKCKTDSSSRYCPDGYTNKGNKCISNAKICTGEIKGKCQITKFKNNTELGHCNVNLKDNTQLNNSLIRLDGLRNKCYYDKCKNCKYFSMGLPFVRCTSPPNFLIS